MIITILMDIDFDIANCKKGYIAVLMIDEWWLFLKTDKLTHLGIYENLEDIRKYLHRHFTATTKN